MVRSEKTHIISSGQYYEISQIDKGFIVNKPGLQIINTSNII